MSDYNGLFRARIVNTDKFIDSGVLSVYIEGISSIEEDYYTCIIASPFSGIPGSGFIAAPPIGCTGYVLYVHGDITDTCVWMGSPIIQAEQNLMLEDDKKLKTPPEVTDASTIVLRSQYTSKDKGGDDLTSDKNKVESVIKLNETEFTLMKLKTDDKYKYEKDSYKFTDDKNTFITMKDNEINIRYINSNDKEMLITISDDSFEIIYDNKNKITLNDDYIELNADSKSYIKLGTDGITEIHGDKYITLNGSDDNATKWQAFSDMISTYNTHTHAMGSDNSAGGPPLPSSAGLANVFSIFGASNQITAQSSPPIQQYNPKRRQRWTLNRMEFDKPPTQISSQSNNFRTNFGMGYTNSKASKSDKNKLG